jgi:hypothetical protein
MVLSCRLLRVRDSALVTGFVVAALLWLAASPALSGPPRVEFDVATSVACREVTTPEFAAAFPSEKLMQATFNISSLVRRGRQSDLAEFFYRIESPQGTLRIVDHLPRQELASPYVGPIAVEKKDEASAKIGGLITGHYPPFSNAQLNAQAGTTNGMVVRYEMLPPKELLAASGTLNRERGVYFKLRPSAQTSLEGAKQFICVLRVPRGWRGDCVRIDCQAACDARSSWPIGEGPSDGGAASFLVALFAAGDEEARHVMTQVVTADEQLTAAVRRNREVVIAAIDRSSLPGYAELRRLMSPPALLAMKGRLLERHATGKLPGALPPDLRQAIDALPAAERAARPLAGK